MAASAVTVSRDDGCNGFSVNTCSSSAAAAAAEAAAVTSQSLKIKINFAAAVNFLVPLSNLWCEETIEVGDVWKPPLV